MLSPMNRVVQAFERLRACRGKALMPFVTAGDPSLAATSAVLAAAADAGAAVCEVGIPFSDPIADGPVIQESMTWALNRGTKVAGVFDAVRQARQRGGAAMNSLGLMAMVSYSIVHRLGPDRFVADAKAAGFDGLIVPDLPVEACEGLRRHIDAAGLVLSLLIAPTTTRDRARQIAQACSGFVYVVSRAGITGEQTALPPELPQRIEALRAVTDLPIAVGFGISTAAQVRQVCEVADAAIVGSAMVRGLASLREAAPDTIAEHAGALVRELAGGLTPAAT